MTALEHPRWLAATGGVTLLDVIASAYGAWQSASVTPLERERKNGFSYLLTQAQNDGGYFVAFSFTGVLGALFRLPFTAITE